MIQYAVIGCQNLRGYTRINLVAAQLLLHILSLLTKEKKRESRPKKKAKLPNSSKQTGD
jgi:hypothetical protein